MPRCLCVAGLAFALASTAQARVETLRWSHTAPPEASGFRIHVGSASRTYDRTIEAGLPAADADGVFSYDLQVADDETVYVAVSAYNAGGESPLSNERLREPAPPPPPSGDPGVIFSEDFETSALGRSVPGWVDTRAGNSLLEDDSLFRVVDLGGNRVFGTSSTLGDIHSHFISNESPGWTSYEFRGRMLITVPDGGIGVTIYSQYTGADSYYRIMRWQDGDFSMQPHPDPSPVECESSRTGTVPQVDRWYRFRLKVTPGEYSTSIRGKVWQENDPEPNFWPVRCEDPLPDRVESGTVGVWSMGAGSKYWDDLEVIALSGDPTLGRPGQPRVVLPE